MMQDPAANFVTPRRVDLGVRPPRFGVLIPPDLGPGGLLETIGTLCAIWGGFPSPLIPTDGRTIDEPFWKLLRLADPDEIVRLDSLGPISEELAGDLARNLSLFNDFPPGNKILGVNAVPYPLPRTVEIVRPNEIGLVETPLVNAPDLVHLYVSSLVGLLSPVTVSRLSARGITTTPLALREPQEVISFIDDRLNGPGGSPTPSRGLQPRDLSNWALARYGPATRPGHRPLVLVVGDTPIDFSLLMTLQSTRDDVYWLPFAFAGQVDERPRNRSPRSIEAQIALTILNAVAYAAIRPWRTNHELLLTSLSLTPDDLSACARKAAAVAARWPAPEGLAASVRVVPPDTDWAEFLAYRSTRWELNNVGAVNSYTLMFAQGTSGPNLPTPRPKKPDFSSPDAGAWVAEASIQGLHLPPRRRLLGLIAPETGGMASLRLSQTGVAYYSFKHLTFGHEDLDARMVHPALRIPADQQVFDELFAEAGLRSQVSQAGRYLAEIVRLFGGVRPTATALRNGATWPVLSKYLDESENRPGITDAGVMLRNRRYLDLRSVSALLLASGTPEEDGPKLAAATMGAILRMGIVRRGLLLKCERCNDADWYHVGTVADRFECRRCGFLQYFPADREWSFSLNEIAYQALKNGQRPAALALDVLERRSRSTFLWAPALDVYRMDATDERVCEIDFAAVIDGRLFIGEAKQSDEILVRQLRGMKTLAERLRPDGIVLATSEPRWSTTADGRFASTFPSGRSPEVTKLVAADLLAA